MRVLNKRKCAKCAKEFTPKYMVHRFCSIACSNRFNLNNKNVVHLPQQYSAELAELFGILLGDGSVTRYYTKVYLNLTADKGYAPFVRKICKRLFKGVPVTITPRPARGTEEVQISSCDVSKYLLGVEFEPRERTIPDWIIRNKTFVKATIRGLFDTEGSVGIKYFEGKNGNYFYKQLTFTNKNENILKFIEEELCKMGYLVTKNSKKNIYISNAKNIDRYFREIGSSNPKLTKKLKSRVIDGYRYGKN